MPALPKRLVQILETRRLLDTKFLRVDRSKISYSLPDGERREQVRLNVDRGNAVAAILHEPSANKLYFVRQFRFSTYVEADEPSPDNGWLLELIAGVIEPSERQEESILREIEEETGFKKILACEPIGAFYLTPGASSEQIFLFYVAVDAEGRASGKGAAELRGVSDEEVITETMTPAEFLQRVEAMQIRDAKTLAAAEYVRRRKDVFQLS